MNNVVDLPNHERHMEEASLWVARLDRELSAQEARDLRVWLSHDSDNRKALERLAKLWDKMDRLALLADIVPLPVQQRRYRMPLAIAASAALLAIAIGMVWHFHQALAESQLADGFYQTAIGEQRTLALPDHSQLVLNTNSQVKIVFTPQQRLILLDRGEIHIEVAHDVTRPLSVVAGGKVVQAVGTAFDVHLIDNDNVDLLVTEGKVLVAERKLINTSAPLSGITRLLPSSAVSVSVGEHAHLGSQQPMVEKLNSVDITEKLSWRQGNIIFRGEMLDDAVHEFSRYSDKKFIIQDASLKEVRVAGVFRAGDTEGLLRTLNNNFAIEHEYGAGNTILLYARTTGRAASER